MLKKHKNSVAFQVFLIIMGFSVLLTISTGSLRTYMDYRNLSASIEEEIEQLAKSNSIGIAASLWVMETHDIQVHLEGLLNHPHIEHISIHKKQQAIASAGVKKSKWIIQREYPLYHAYNGKQVYLGTLLVTAGLDQARKDLRNNMLRRFFYDGILILLIALSIFIIVHVIITKRLSAIARHVSKMKPVDAGDPLVVPKRLFHKTQDELDHVVTAINTMRAGLRKAFQEMNNEIAERRQAEESARGEKELFALFIRHSPIYAYIKEVTPTQSRVLQASENFQRMIGIPGSAMAGKTMADLFPPEFAARITADDWTVVSCGKVLNLEENLNGRIYDTIKFPLAIGDKHLLAGYTIDVTERRLTEEELRESDELLNFVMQGTETGMWDWDLATNRVHYSPQWKRLLGYEEQEVADHLDEWKSLTHPDDIEPTLAKVNAFLRQPVGTLRAEFRMRHKSGEYRWVLSSATVRLGDDGKPIRLIGLHIDITERKRAEEEVRGLNTSYDRLTNNADEAIFRVEAAGGHILYCNPAAERIFGYSMKEWQADPSIGFRQIHPDYREKQKQIIEQINGTKQPIKNVELGWISKDGRPVIMEYSIIPICNAKGEIICFESIGKDITLRKRAEEALRESEHRISEALEFNKSILRTSSIGILTYNASGQCVFANEAAAEIAGTDVAGLLAQNFHQLQSWKKSGMYEAAVMALDTGNEQQKEAHLVTTFGKDIWLNMRFSSFPSQREKHLLVFTYDITERKRAEEKIRDFAVKLEGMVDERTADLLQAQEALASLVEDLNEKTDELVKTNRRLREMDRLKSVFLATMSHELRTPLNSIIGFTGILLQRLPGPINDEQFKQLRMVQDSARHLLNLINDVLDISKIEAGQVQIVKRPFDMHAVVEHVLQTVQPQAVKKGLSLEAVFEPGISAPESDQRRVEQILINLVNNAVKFTEKGEIVIRCRMRDGRLETSVRDTGIGVRPENLDKLFQPFRQIETGLDRSYEGTGLGLSICRKLLELLGGEIRAESTWGVGSTFTFTLPLEGNRL